MDFSVVIPVLDEAPYLDQCLTALSMQRLPSDRYEVIVVDNGSTDASLEILRGWPEVRVLHEPKPDPYLARNRGVLAAKGRIVAFTDADCRVENDWLLRMHHAFDVEGADIVVGRLAYPDAATRWLGFYAAYYDAKTRWLFETPINECLYGHGGNMAVRKDIFDQVGLFHPMPRVGDTELLHRVLEAWPDAKLRYSAETVVTHLEVNTLFEMLPKLARYGGYSNAVSAASGYRTLSLRERLEVARRCVVENHYGPLRCLGLALVLAVGAAAFELGRRESSS